VVFFSSGDRIAKAKVLVLQAGNEIAVQQTGDVQLAIGYGVGV
jgi:hypothetical protein